MRRLMLVPVALVVLGMAAAPEKVKLEFKHSENSTTRAKAATKTHQILTIAGMDIETASDSNVALVSSVGKRGADGRLPITEKIESLSVHLSLPGGIAIDFDSSNPASGKSDNPQLQALLDMFRARVGSSYTVVLGKDNKVVAVEGTEKLLENASPAAAELLRNEVKPETIQREAQQSLSILPDGPVDVGDSWTRSSVNAIGGGQTLSFETRYEYLGTEEKDGQKLDKVGVKAITVSYALDAGSPSPLKVTNSDLKIASSDGVLLFDRAQGRPVESKAVTRITGDMTFSINGMELPGKLDLTFDSTASLEN